MSDYTDDVRRMMIAGIRGDELEMLRILEETSDMTDIVAGLLRTAVAGWRHVAHIHGDTDEDLIRKFETGA